MTPLSLDFGESSLDHICPVSPLQKYIIFLRIFPVTPVSLDFGESLLDYICPVSPIQKYTLLPTYISSDSCVI